MYSWSFLLPAYQFSFSFLRASFPLYATLYSVLKGWSSNYGSKEYSNSGEGSEGIRQTRWKHLVKHDSYSRQHWVCFSPPSQGSIPSFFKVDVHHWRQSHYDVINVYRNALSLEMWIKRLYIPSYASSRHSYASSQQYFLRENFYFIGVREQTWLGFYIHSFEN